MEARLIMLRRALNRLRCNHVELKTDAVKHHLRYAVLRPNTKQDAMLSKLMTTSTDFAYLSPKTKRDQPSSNVTGPVGYP